MRRTLPFFVLLIFLAPQSFAESPEERREDIDHFKLFANCTMMDFLVERLPSGASDVGLSYEMIQTAVESRLRSARLYRSDVELVPYLYVAVNVIGRAFSTSIEYNKSLYDADFAGSFGIATTWKLSSAGTHGGDAAYIVSAVSRSVDRFLVEYLRTNEDACG